MKLKNRIDKLEKQKNQKASRNPLVMPIVDYRNMGNPPGAIPIRFVDMGNGEGETDEQETDERGETAKDEK